MAFTGSGKFIATEKKLFLDRQYQKDHRFICERFFILRTLPYANKSLNPQ